MKVSASKSAISQIFKTMERNPFYGKLLRSSNSRPFPRLCVPSVAINPISLTNADCVHHAFEEIGLIKKSFPFSEINFPKIIFFYELRQAPTLMVILGAYITIANYNMHIDKT